MKNHSLTPLYSYLDVSFFRVVGLYRVVVVQFIPSVGHTYINTPLFVAGF